VSKGADAGTQKGANMVISRCRCIGPPSSGIVLGTLFLLAADLRRYPISAPTPSFFCCVGVPVPRGVSVIPRAVSLSCFYKSIYRHLGNTPPPFTTREDGPFAQLGGGGLTRTGDRQQQPVRERESV